MKYSFESEPEEFSKRRQEAENLVEKLEMPESIRTPGRTWTSYPEIELENIEDAEPSIELEGEAEVFRGREAVEKAGEKLLDAIKPGENRLNAFHAAYLNSAVYIRVEGQAEVEIVYNQDSPLLAHLVIETETNAELTVTEEFRGNPGFVTSMDEIYLGDNSTVTYGAVESIEDGFSYSARKAVVGRDASMNWLNGIFGANLSRTRIETMLKGDNSETEKIGVWYPTDDQHTDISLQAYHIGDGTRCDMNSRAVVDDKSRSVYEGLQDVGDNADDTSSFQRENVLTLSDRAEVDASPKLMIENPDVEASHAASAGNLPEEQLHYMESRGLEEKKAQRLIVKGFFEPVMDEIKLPGLKQKIRTEVQRKLDR